MRKILLCSADRAEHGLLVPIYEELKQRQDVSVEWCFLDSHADPVSNLLVYREKLEDFQPHLILLPTDRSEIVYAAAYSFHKGYLNVHFHAGNNPSNHPDDINRRVISAFSHVLLANMEEHKQNLIRQGEESWRIHVVGSTAFDNIEIDESLCPEKPFDLVILHPDPISAFNTECDLRSMSSAFNTANEIVWLAPNHDRNYELILDYMKNNDWASFIHRIYKNLPRSQFLGLLKNCKKAIGNSSSFYYELPVLNPNAGFHQIGRRNRGLRVPVATIGGSKRIADLLSTIELTDDLRFKRLTYAENIVFSRA